MTQPRKGEKSRPEFASFVRDALTTRREIEGKSDPCERQRVERKRDIAIDEIVTMYRDYKKQGQLDKLPPDFWIVCEHLKCRNGGKLPTTTAESNTVTAALTKAQCEAAKSLSIQVNPQFGRLDYTQYTVVPAPDTLSRPAGVPSPASTTGLAPAC